MTSDVLYVLVQDHQTQLNIMLEWELHLHITGWYLIVEKFHIVQIFRKHNGNTKI